MDTRSKAYQAEEAKALGRILVKRSDYNDALRFAEAVMHHPIARDLLKPGLEVEQSMFWTDPHTGLPCRGRIDALRRDYRIMMDVKSTERADHDHFRRSVEEYRYHWQNLFYVEGAEQIELFKPEAFIFFAIEKEAPFLVGAYEIEPRALELAYGQVRKAMEEMAEARRTGVWPGLPNALQSLELSHFAYR